MIHLMFFLPEDVWFRFGASEVLLRKAFFIYISASSISAKLTMTRQGALF